ncbi:sulfatase family protein [Rhodopirellula sp. SWK7]|uniref:sulfatase family protein n=1 Tax=Rhodopirellula sp. SWK7 TaxID=595460 RepID=UPI0002BD97E2|nr:arylsulfatase [Rhodopirellula sp. SWK7]EMI40442.1 arylsulfatase A [Rhodopirellula sp. SWK7]
MRHDYKVRTKPTAGPARRRLAAIAMTAAFLSFSLSAFAADSFPNVVLIYGDDVGYGDVGVNGATKIPTPNIDALAASSLNFTDGHCSASTCTPSRFSLLTGRHAFRQGVRIAPPNASLLINPDDLTLPRLFQKAGYRTGIVGKWHLGLGKKGSQPDWNGELKPGPLELGFDSSFILPTTNDRVPCVFVDGHHVVNLDLTDPIHVGDKLSDVDQPESTQYPDAKKNPKAFYNSVVNGIGRIGYMSGGKSALWDDYTMADVLVENAKVFIADQDEQPFFLFFSSQDIHIPNAPNPRFQGSTELGSRGDAMVQLDWSVGAILAELDQRGLSDNTLVIFSSDNGPTHHSDAYETTKQVRAYSPDMNDGHDASGKWRGGKYEIYEGGTRVPLMIRWPNHIRPGESAALVNQIDFIASFSKLLGITLAPTQAPDSRETLDAFLGKDLNGLSFTIEEGRSAALRVGDWKYIPAINAKWAEGFWPVEDCLFDLSNDAGEQHNVFDQHPERAATMAAQLEKLRVSDGVRNASGGTSRRLP